MLKILVTFLLASYSVSAQVREFLTYDNQPMGTVAKPLLLRTFMPLGDVQDSVLGNHHLSKESPRYNTKLGKDVSGVYKPIAGLPAAMGVNYGKRLSYCWDTVECRLMYAWCDGFLDMRNYWGDPENGGRKSFGYVPDIVGDMFYVASGEHPIRVDGRAIESPRYVGYKKVDDRFLFKFKTKVGLAIQTEIKVMAASNSLEQHVELLGDGKLSYMATRTNGVSVKRVSEKKVIITIQHGTLKRYVVKEDKALTAGDVSVENGEKIFNAMACITCHSTDGSRSHGPTLKGVAGSLRPIADMKDMILADDAYIMESIISPNKKVVRGFPPNYMPPFKLGDHEMKSLVLYIKSLRNQ